MLAEVASLNARGAFSSDQPAAKGARVYELPARVQVRLLALEVNVYSEMTPWRDVTSIDQLVERAAGYAIPAVQVDGNDVWAVAQAVAEARDRALNGGGPTFIEAQTERLVGHYSGDVQAYRPPGEIEAAKAREPLVVFEQHAARVWPGHRVDYEGIRATVQQQIESAVAEARQIPEPSPDSLMEHLYA